MDLYYLFEITRLNKLTFGQCPYSLRCNCVHPTLSASVTLLSINFPVKCLNKTQSKLTHKVRCSFRWFNSTLRYIRYVNVKCNS